jgi:triosephosphate isomerase
VHAFIRAKLKELFGEQTAQSTRIQYGGSVNAKNIEVLMSKSDIDGALIGGASLDAKGFADIIKKTLNIKKE